MLLFGTQVERSNRNRIIKAVSININILLALIGIFKVFDSHNHMVDSILRKFSRLGVPPQTREHGAYVQLGGGNVRQRRPIFKI